MTMVAYEFVREFKSYDEMETEIANTKFNDKNMGIMMNAEFGIFNYEAMKVIMNELEKWDYDYEEDNGMNDDYEVPVLDDKRIKEWATKINERGGLQALQMNYYVMLYFMINNLKDKYKVKHLQSVFDGIGDWKN